MGNNSRDGHSQGSCCKFDCVYRNSEKICRTCFKFDLYAKETSKEKETLDRIYGKRDETKKESK